jgi:5-methylcytosine-specific restriction endonuclease McrA
MICDNCSSPLVDGQRRFCSRACGNHHYKIRRRVLPIPEKCEHCGKPFGEFRRGRPRRFCGASCRLRRIQVLEPCQKIICAGCPTEFTQKQHGQKFCSIKCQNITRWRTSTHKRRIRLRSQTTVVELIQHDDIFARDRWRCQLCGVRVLKSKRGTHDPRAPELDHIIPISRGGAHVKTNVQCACHACNMAKADKPLGQLRLFG